ncbi:MAG TPA: hypothetical protein VLF67_00235, partial [Candidatus Saccharimonas sp.]|nr:hypothetical protein [Candidatus Saccharimonas sp.]
MPQLIGQAQAGVAFNELYVRFDRMQELTATTGTVCAKTPASATGLGTETKVKVEFPKQVINTDYVIDQTAADWAVSTTNLPIDPNTPGTPATAWPGITAPAGAGDFGVGPDGGVTVRFASGNLSASTFYCFNFGPSGATAVVTNSSKYDTTVGGEKALVGRLTTLAGTTVINDTEYAADVVSKDTITVTAVVPPLFTMDLEPTGGTPVAYTGIDAFLSDLSTSATIFTGGVEANITTNAPNGWVTWVKDLNQGLKSTLAGNYVLPTVGGGTPSNVALVPDTKQYGAYGT